MRRCGLLGVICVVLTCLWVTSAVAIPPAHAPAHGYRRKHSTVRVVYTPAPFIYSGVTYVPLRDATSLIGAALLWDSLKGRAMFTFNGREVALVVGSPNVIIGSETVVLAAAPIVVSNVVYVPVDFCERDLRIPVERSHGVVKLKGHSGWHSYRVATRPPGRVVRHFGRASAPRVRHSPRPVIRERSGHEARPRHEASAPRQRGHGVREGGKARHGEMQQERRQHGGGKGKRSSQGGPKGGRGKGRK